MSEHVEKTIAEYRALIEAQESLLRDKKRVVNDLCEMAGLPKTYADVDLQPKATTGGFRSDQFYGKPLASSVRQILEARFASNLGPATIYEIFDVLKAGGYAGEGTDEVMRRGVSISIAKNTAMFHRLPNDKIGLLSWYPNAKKPKDEENNVTEDKPKPKSEPGKIPDAVRPIVDAHQKKETP